MTVTITKYSETDPKKVLKNLVKYYKQCSDNPDIKPTFDSFETFTVVLRLSVECTENMGNAERITST